MDAYKILAVCWFNTGDNMTIGIVAVETFAPREEWKAYIGVGRGYNHQSDEQHIAALGTGLSPVEAAGFFSHLDIAKYKKDG